MLIQHEIPWEVRAGLMFAAPDDQLKSIMPWDDDAYFAVSVTHDLTVKWWLIQRNHDGDFEVERVYLR